MQNDPAKTRLLLLGTLTESVVSLDPAFATTAEPSTVGDVGVNRMRIEVEFASVEGSLARAPLWAGPGCSLGVAGDRTLYSFFGVVDMQADATRLLRKVGGRIIKEVERAASLPSAELLWQPAGGSAGRQAITWRAWHAEQKTVYAVVEITRDDGKSWTRLTAPTTDNSAMVDLDELPGGKARLSLLVTDGLNNVRAVSAPFVLPTRACVAVITQPLDGAKLLFGQSIVACGHGYWPDEDRPELQDLIWENPDGNEVGRGAMVELKGLGPGEHRLRLLAGSGQRQGKAEIQISVG
jgi:hypothetical protein